jgi:hypothetical protein
MKDEVVAKFDLREEQVMVLYRPAGGTDIKGGALG